MTAGTAGATSAWRDVSRAALRAWVDSPTARAADERTLGQGGPRVRHRGAHHAASSSTGSSSASPATPATACSSPATASPAPARCSATTWRRCPSSRPRSGRPAGTLAGVSAFQVHISDHDITTPGDAPNVLVAMNPAALRAELAPARAGRHADRQHRHLRRAQPHQGRLRGQPARPTAASRATRSTRCR